MKVSTASHDTTKLVEGLAAAPDLLESAVQGIDQALLDIAEEGEWSVQTILAHLRDDEFMVMRPRLVRMTIEDHPQLAPFDEKAWATTRWQGRDAPHESLADFRLQRQASMMLLHRLQQGDWQRTASHAELGVFDVGWWVEHWWEHDRAHIAQIEATLQRARALHSD